MRFLSSAAAASSLIASAASTGIMVPLYVDPGSGAANWDSTFQAAQDSTTQWTMIINPNSGPGSSTPSQDYATGTAKFNAMSNVRTIGYIHTSWGSRSLDDIQNDLNSWKAWGSGSTNASVQGIFYDEAAINNDANIKSITDMARQTLGNDIMTVCNFGTTPPESTYSDCSIERGL